MKTFIKSIAITISGITVSTSIIAQDCKFDKEEMDPFTNSRVLHSKMIPMLQAMGDSEHDLQIQKNGNNYFIYLYSTITSGDKLTFSINEGQPMIFLLENKDTIQIRAIESVTGKEPKANQGWTGSVFRGAVTNTYEISSGQLERLKISPVQMIRFHFTTSDNRDIKVDRKKIPDGAKEKLRQAITCVMLN